MATHQNNIPFQLERKDVVLVKPAKPTPFQVLSLSTIDNDPNLEILCQTIYVYKANPISSNGKVHHHDDDDDITVALYKKNLDPACVIKDAISKVLVHYYPLAGKLKRDSVNGRLSITCKGDGVPFLEATANCQLSILNYLDGVDVKIAKQFAFDFASKGESGYYPLVFQVTKFTCGGFTIGMGLSHSVADGFGAAQFFRAMCELACGKIEPTVKPVWEREKLIAKPAKTEEPILQIPTHMAGNLATSPFMPTTDIMHECFYVKNETITKLKANLMKECGEDSLKESFTTLEVLGAYVWRSRFRAFKLDPDENTLFVLTMGIRKLVNPPLPTGFYGNAFVPSNVILKGKKLDESALSEVAKLIKDKKKDCASSEYISKHIETMEKLLDMNVRIEGGNGGNMLLTDWRQLGLLEEEDFGWKGAVNIIPVPWNMFGYVDLCIFMPACNLNPEMKGGVRVLVSLPAAAMDKFKQEMDALLQIPDDTPHQKIKA